MRLFNARNYFDQPIPNAEGILVNRTPLYRRQDYGGTIGGPLFIPNHYNAKKDKTFFFWSEELRLEEDACGLQPGRAHAWPSARATSAMSALRQAEHAVALTIPTPGNIPIARFLDR